MTDRTERIRQAFERGNAGDRRGAMADFRADYVHHSNVFGDLEGLDTYFERWVPAMEAAKVHQEVTGVVEHGPFVVVTVNQSSAFSPEPKAGLHVYRWEGDQIVELWSLTDPT